MKINELAQNICQSATKNDHKFAFDPLTILTIISIIVGIIRIMISCNIFGRNAYNRIKSPGLIDRTIINRVVSNKLPKEMQHLKSEIVKSVIEQASKLDEQSFMSMVQEVKEGKYE